MKTRTEYRSIPILIKILLFFLPVVLNGQKAKDGAMIVNGNAIINEYTYLTDDAFAGDNIIKVASSNLNQSGRFSQVLSPGDLLFIIQIRGVAISTSNDEFYGGIQNYHNCGNYEFVQVDSVPDAFHISLTCPLNFNYDASYAVVVVRVPRFSSLTVNNSGVITCDKWDGITGGIVVAEVSGPLTINSGGKIDVSGMGFRGGSVYDTLSEWGVVYHAWHEKTRGAEKGESTFGFGNEYDQIGGRYCRGAAANGGGGGNAHNAGGGGGANAGDVALWTGLGNPDVSTTSWTNAWDLEIPGLSATTSSGGGKGGYTFSSANLNALSEGPNGHNGNSLWGGDWRRATGGVGGRPLDYSTGKLFFGGGGGAGDQNENYGGKGGDAGGLVYLSIYGNVSGSGLILANGQDGADAIGPQPLSGTTGTDGAGGGGAGGTVVVNSAGNISGISIYANGGKGGNQVIKKGLFNSSTEAEGPGGGGSGGFIACSGGTPLKQAAGGVNGTTNSSGLTEFPPNGATAGGDGITNATISNFYFVTNNDTVCKGETAVLSAFLAGVVPPGTIPEWFDKAVGGNQLGSGNFINIPNVSASAVYWVGACPAVYREPVSVIVMPLIVDAGNDTSVCEGNSVMLNAVGGISCIWNHPETLDDEFLYSPLASPISSVYYNVVVFDEYGCSATDSVYVSVYSNPVVNAGQDTSICAGSSVTLNASGGISFLWSPGNTLNNPDVYNPIASPLTTTIYTVVGFNNNSCSNSDTIQVIVFSVPDAVILTTDETCSGASDGKVMIDISGGAAPYSVYWDTGYDGIEADSLVPGLYSVVITDANQCTVSKSFNISESFENCFTPHIAIPNIFSPNNDGQNDILFVRGEGVVKLNFVIFNRWGKIVFETNSINEGWNGIYGGKPQPVDSYVYTVDVEFVNGKKLTESGTISLIR